MVHAVWAHARVGGKTHDRVRGPEGTVEGACRERRKNGPIEAYGSRHLEGCRLFDSSTTDLHSSLPVVDAKRRAGGVYCPEKGGGHAGNAGEKTRTPALTKKLARATTCFIIIMGFICE